MNAPPKPSGAALPRRSFFLRSAGVAAAAAVPLRAVAQPAPHAAHANTAAPAPQALLFFNPWEAAWIDAATDRLIPADASGPGALQAGVPGFIDRQLAGAWGAGERLYRSGPWQAGLPQQGYQLPYTPAELFRAALTAWRSAEQAGGGTAFTAQDGPARDAALRALQAGERTFGEVPGDVFFESLWALTLEGYFCDPVHGGNQGMAAWRMLGFPGAYANYYHLVDQHNLRFEAEPVSLGDAPVGAHGHRTSRHGGHHG